MNYENLQKLASILNEQHGKEDHYGFIVAPLEEVVIKEHKKAMVVTGRIFNYPEEANEKFGILSVTREEIVHDDSSKKIDYTMSKLENIGHQDLVTNENATLLNTYLEYIRSRPTGN